jgi:maleate isomerase
MTVARRRLGMLTPSSNTVLEPVTAAMLAGLDDVSAHFARFPVTEIALTAPALGQFDLGRLLDAAQRLADARVDVIAWNGTSAGWLGTQADRDLTAAITAETGLPATSSVLALVEIFHLTGVRRFGLVTPYLDDVQARIVATLAAEGFTCAGERHLKIQDNFAFAEVGAAEIERMTGEVAAARPDAITIFCTNLRGAPLVERLERAVGVPVYDTVATAVWASLRLTGVEPARVRGWGRLFAEVR